MKSAGKEILINDFSTIMFEVSEEVLTHQDIIYERFREQ